MTFTKDDVETLRMLAEKPNPDDLIYWILMGRKMEYFKSKHPDLLETIVLYHATANVLYDKVTKIIKSAVNDESKSHKYYSVGETGTVYKPGKDPEVTCWHCEKTFLCDPMDATCRLCSAPYDKSRCEEFKFTPKGG